MASSSDDATSLNLTDLPDELLNDIVLQCGLRTLVAARGASRQLNGLADLQLASNAICCACCSMPLCLRRNVRLESAALRLEDGKTVCIEQSDEVAFALPPELYRPTRGEWLRVRGAVDVHLNPPKPPSGPPNSARARLIRDGKQLSGFKVQHVSCPRCALHLGLIIREPEFRGEVGADALGSTGLLGCARVVLRYLRLPPAFTLHASNGALVRAFEPFSWSASQSRELRCTGLGATQLSSGGEAGMRLKARTLVSRLFKPTSGLAAATCEPTPPPPQSAARCGNVLTCEDAVLSTQHRWDAGRGSEPAWYVNCVRHGATRLSNQREEELAQGRMVVADVACAACGATVGWKFCRDLGHDLPNVCQVGRYGLVLSSLDLSRRQQQGGSANLPDADGESDDDSEQSDGAVPPMSQIHALLHLAFEPGSQIQALLQAHQPDQP